MHTSTGKRTERFTDKVIISGLEVEHYQYKDSFILRNYKRQPRKQDEQRAKEKKEQSEKSQSSVRRTKVEIRRRINSNDDLVKFLTLTTTNPNIDETNRAFNLFTQRMNDRFPEFRYLAVPEFQKDVDFHGNIKSEGGAVHYHLVCNLRYVESKQLEEIWGQGFIKIKRVKRLSNLGGYLCKYLQKDMFDKRMFGKKKFFCSQNLKKSLELVGENAVGFLEDGKDFLEETYKKEFQSEYRGNIVYTVFKMKEG